MAWKLSNRLLFLGIIIKVLCYVIVKLSYFQSVFTCSKLTIKTLGRKQCEISSKLTKNLPKKGCLQDLSNLDIHSSSCKKSDFSGSDADSDAKL